MRRRDRVGLLVGPILLRLALGVTFLWAGLGKVSEKMEVKGESAAYLANLGVTLDDAGPPRQGPPVPSTTPVLTPPTPPVTTPESAQPADTFTKGNPGKAAATPVLPATATPASPRLFTAADFPEPRRCARLYGLALAIRGAAEPGADPALGRERPRLWPPQLARGSWPVYLAYAVVVAEIGGGIMLLIGLLTRVWAAAVASVMLGALWLTQIGPAIQSGSTTLGFLPAYPTYDPAWMTPLWQFLLLMSALAVACTGPGALAIDNLLFGREDEEAPDGE